VQVELFTFHGSNACLTAELVLDHAGIEWRRRGMRPGLHAIELRLRGFPGPTAPAALIDGERVQGSRRIARAVADAVPQLGLLPQEPALRERVLEAERDGERLQNAVRRMLYVLAGGDPSLVRPMIDANFRRAPRAVRAGIARAIVRAATIAHKASPARVERDVARLGELLDRFDALVDEGVLGTDAPTIADFQIAPNLAALALEPNARAQLRERPCWRIAQRCCDEYPIRFEIAIPEAWLEQLRR
jgi:glutathione S-transferase